MRPALLFLDDALSGQTEFLQRAAGNAPSINAITLAPALRLWSRPAALDLFRDALREISYRPANPEVWFAGSGDFHHIACLLIERIAETRDAPFTVIHFDNHPDWVRFANGMHCGSWVSRAARLPQVQRVLTVGPCSKDVMTPDVKRADLSLLSEDRVRLFPYRTPAGPLQLCGREWPSIEEMGEGFGAALLDQIGTTDVYISIDKDVLRPDDAATNWDQGAMPLATLLGLLSLISQGHRIIGADVFGDWSPPAYGMALAGWLKRGETLLDQPRSAPRQPAVRNEAGNLALLDIFEHAGK